MKRWWSLALVAAVIVGVGANIQTKNRFIGFVAVPGKYVPVVHFVWKQVDE